MDRLAARFPLSPLDVRAYAESGAMTETFDLAAIAYARWKRAVDLLAREAVRRRRAAAAEAERRRAQQRARSLRRIVRRALSELHRAELERQKSREAALRAPGLRDQVRGLP
jgi:hypothetical protein